MLPEEAGEEWRSWTHQTQLRHGPSEGTGCPQPLSKEAAPACSICSLTVSHKPCRCSGTCFVLMVSEGNAALVSTYTCTLLHCTGLCQRSAPPVSACSFGSWGPGCLLAPVGSFPAFVSGDFSMPCTNLVFRSL